MKREIIEIAAADTVPSVEQILAAQGVPSNAALTVKIKNLADRAVSIYSDIASPSGIIMPISRSEFQDIYPGEGLNATETPLDSIVTHGETFCLFAVTVGAEVTNKITSLFDICEFALASMLDSAASEGTEIAAQWLEEHYVAYLKDAGIFDDTDGALRFSPGYCGWHVSAQRKLFRHLRPEDVGICLTESCLMQPLKSISGVIISGDKEIFDFEDTYSFCSECVDHSCIERLRHMMKT